MERERPIREIGRTKPKTTTPQKGAAVVAPIDLEKRSAEIAKANGLPLQLAKQVASGQMELNEAITRLAFQDEVNALMQRHGFNRALATQIALGQVNKEVMLAKRRVDENLYQSRLRSVLEESKTDGRELLVCVHGRKQLRIKVLDVQQYEVICEDLDTHQSLTLHKLQFKLAWLATEMKKVKKSLNWDKIRKDKERQPVLRPQDRYACSDRRLGLAMDRKLDVVVTTLEGEMLGGQIVWVSRYEFGIRTRQGTEVVVFRHALDDMKGDN